MIYRTKVVAEVSRHRAAPDLPYRGYRLVWVIILPNGQAAGLYGKLDEAFEAQQRIERRLRSPARDPIHTPVLG